MKILGIESSADETAAAVVQDGTTVLSSIVASQMDIHTKFGGMVPEVAARSHIEVILPIIQEALDQAKITLDEIDGVAVTYGPGLVGSLLIGSLAGRTIAQLAGKPLYAINHVEAHVYANFLTEPLPSFPLLTLIVSGGHTQLALFKDHGDYELLGRTRDDAAGEAFDKVARIIGLPYPGGPAVSEAAKVGDESAFAFPKPKLGKDSLEFSFSGLKTAVLRAAQAEVGGDFRTKSYEIPALLSRKQQVDIAASFQKTVVEILVGRVMQAYQEHQPASVVIAGGVAANKALQEALKAQLPLPIHYAPMQYYTDNAAMIASLGYFKAQSGQNTDPLELKVDPILSM